MGRAGHESARHLSRGVGELSTFGCSGICGPREESGHQKRLCAMRAGWRHSMTKCTILGVVVILSTAITTPGLAQAVTQQPNIYASYRPNGSLGIASAPLRRREEVVVGRGTADAMALAPSFHLSMVGKETTTRPWTSPVGHRQPRAAGVTSCRVIAGPVRPNDDHRS